MVKRQTLRWMRWLLVAVGILVIGHMDAPQASRGEGLRRQGRLAAGRRTRLARRRAAADRQRQPPVQYGAANPGLLDPVPVTDEGREVAGIEVTADARAVAESNNRFALALYQHLRQEEGNLFFSPFSISTALAMVYAGAAHETERQMAEVLSFELPHHRLHTGFSVLNSLLNAPGAGSEIHLANRLWRQEGFEFEAAFLESASRHYGAEPGVIDFAQAEEARRAINQWVAKKTNGKILEVLAAGDIQDKTRLVLTNAIYFKGTWRHRFSEGDTREAAFHVAKDRDVQVPMMTQTGGLGYTQTDEVQVLQLPYADGRLAMLVVLPRRVDGLSDVEAQLNGPDVQDWISRLGEYEVETYLPKFTFTSQMGLKEALSSMGMPLAFSNEADFPGMSRQKGQKLFDAIHQAFVDVNEEGTEAAAATGAIGGDVPGPVAQRVVFRADHPFLFLIRDQRTGTILFLGRVVSDF